VENLSDGGVVRANARIVDRLMRDINSVGVEAVGSLLDTHHLLAASLYESGTGIIILGRQPHEREIRIIHANGAAVRLLCASQPERDIPMLFGIDDLEHALGTGTAITKALFDEHGARQWVSLGTKTFGSTTISIAGGRISTRGYASAAVVYLYDATEWKQREEEREEFFSITSHELRTPLVAINGSVKFISDYLANQQTDPTVDELLREISNSSGRLISMVNDFLNMSRLEQGRFSYELTSFDVRKTLSEVVRDLASVAAERGLALTAASGASCSVFADEGRIKQIVTNLAGNALKFTKAGSVTLECTTDGSHVVVRVIDTGEGIPEKARTKLFKKFSQVASGKDALTLDANRSSGLGLYISRLMAEGMACEVSLEASTPGKGSTFALRIPTKKPA
jgi:signal transduction histidine kinase